MSVIFRVQTVHILFVPPPSYQNSSPFPFMEFGGFLPLFLDIFCVTEVFLCEINSIITFIFIATQYQLTWLSSNSWFQLSGITVFGSNKQLLNAELSKWDLHFVFEYIRSVLLCPHIPVCIFQGFILEIRNEYLLFPSAYNCPVVQLELQLCNKIWSTVFPFHIVLVYAILGPEGPSEIASLP